MRGMFEAFTPEWWNAWTTTDPRTGCRIWAGSVCRLGYGRVHWKGKGGVLIHRVAYEQAFGPPAAKLVVCHRCDRPRCTNPDHLFLGTQGDNLRDMFRKGRARPRGKAAGMREIWVASSPTAPARKALAPRLSKQLVAPRTTKRAQVVEGVHLTRTNAGVAQWRLVTGVPSKRPTYAIELYKRPQSWTHKPAE